ncbi:MAG: citrate/2-methylcitrate synthase [Acidimicrobiia bacterium]
MADVARGLKGVVVADTELGDVRGEEGFYHYRQYSAPELAEKRSFEDVAHLLIEGTLPDHRQRERFAEEFRLLRRVPAPVMGLVAPVASACPAPLTCLRTLLSHVAGIEEMPAIVDADAAALRANLLRLSAVAPTLVAAIHRSGQGLEPVPSRDDLGDAANYLWMINGVEPDPARARALDQYLVLALDHGFNASTFTARVVASTGADVGAAIVAALGALSGPRHGGSPSRVLDMFDAIGEPDRAEAWITDAVTRGERIMGFGHPVYKTADPRSKMLRAVAEHFGGSLVDFAVEVEGTVERVLAHLKPGGELHTNVEYYAAVVMHLCGLPRALFTSTFAVSRIVGWSAQVLEQAKDSAIIRPSARYVGPPPPQPVES